jgi:tetratricopeptide (TPR) repeat protein
VIGERPGFIPAYLRLASAHVLNDELDLALDTLQNALKVNSASKDVRRSLARIYQQKKDYKAAEEQLRKILEIDPTDNAARADLGDFLLSVKDVKGAEEVYQQIKLTTPTKPTDYIKLYRIHMKEKSPDKALEALEQGYRKHQQSVPLQIGLVREYVRQKKHTKAIALCEKRIDQNNQDVVAYYLLGVVQGSLKNYPAAEAALQKAIELQPMWPQPHQSMAGIYLAQGKKEEAIQKLEASLEADKRNAAAYLTLGLLYEKDRAFDKAMQVYERALTANPNFWFAANNLAFLLSEFSDQEADFNRALELAQQALKQRPGDPAILDTIGWAHYRLGNFQKALGLIEQALVGAPDSAVLNYHMGMTLYQTNQMGRAREKLETALAGDEAFYGKKEAEEILKKIKG